MSPVPARRPATAPAAPAYKLVSLGNPASYSGGFTLPEGDWALEFMVMMEPQRGEVVRNFEPRLGVMVYAHKMVNGEFVGGEPQEQFYSMGSKAAGSFAPHPDTGKSLVELPEPQGGLNNKTNWYVLLDSLWNSGMPPTIFDNDFTVIDGVWVHTTNVPEPEERKGFAKATGDAEPEKRAPKLIPIVTEIKENGKPWEGTGGLPALDAVLAAPAPKAAPKVAARPAAVAAKPAAAVRRPVAVAAPALIEEAAQEETGGGDEAVMEAAINAVAAALGPNPNGMTKLLMRSSAFKAVTKAAGADMAQAVTEQFFNNDENLSSILGPLGYKIAGGNIAPA